MSAPREPSFFLGYLARRPTPRPAWLDAPGVEWVATVSLDSCPAIGFPGTNRFGLYDSFDDARVAVGGDGSSVFGYRVVAAAYEPGERPFPVGPSHPPAPSHWFRLGYDVVATDGSLAIGMWCSPLVCNHVGAQVPTSRWCLLVELDEAWALARRFAAGDDAVEPGPYLVVEVLTPSVAADTPGPNSPASPTS